jgi:alpha-1,6-mannosyltransferase
VKVCDLTQFYSPFSGGVKRYLEEKRKYAIAHGHHHLLIVPGKHTEKIESASEKVFFIASPLVSRTSRYRALLNLAAVEEILEREKPQVIESSDPYQVAWKAIASGEALRIPVVTHTGGRLLSLTLPRGLPADHHEISWRNRHQRDDGDRQKLRSKSL